MPKQNVLLERPRDVRPRQNDLLLTQKIAADNVILIRLLHRQHGKSCREEIAQDLAFILPQRLILLRTEVLDRCLIRTDQMIIKEEVVPEPQPERLFFLVRRLLVGTRVVEIARIDHRRAPDLPLVHGATEILADLVEELVELQIQLLHLDALILLDILKGQPFDLLPLHTLRQAKTPRKVEHLQIGIQLTEIDLILPRLIQIREEVIHAFKIVLRMAFQRTTIDMRVGKAEKERKVVDMDQKPCERIIAPHDDREKVLDAVPVRTQPLSTLAPPRRLTQIPLRQCARNKNLCASMRQVKALDQRVDIFHEPSRCHAPSIQISIPFILTKVGNDVNAQ